jgi:hypothetical protein
VDEPNRRQPYALLRFRDGTSYQLTPNDVLWTARAVVYEGGRPEDVLWTMGQRFVMLRREYPTFAGFVQAFSQPVNPAWARDGEFCRPRGRYAKTAYCVESKLLRRDEARYATWNDLMQRDTDAVLATLKWANAELPNPVPRATNFAMPDEATAYLARVPGAKLLAQRENWYIAESWSRGWHPDYVTMHSPTSGAEAGVALARPASKAREAVVVAWNALWNPGGLRVL